MSNSIVCGVDQSEHAKQAVRFADRLRERLGLQLILAHATSVPMPISSRAGALGVAMYQPQRYEAALDAGASFLEELAVSEELDDVRLRCEVGIGTVGTSEPRLSGDEPALLAHVVPGQLVLVARAGRHPIGLAHVVREPGGRPAAVGAPPCAEAARSQAAQSAAPSCVPLPLL